MKEIELTQGQVAIVDDEDFEYLSQWKWHAYFRHGNYYAARTARKSEKREKKIIQMHREIIKAPDGLDVDHKNGNTLFNLRTNLRTATNAQNQQNSKKPTSNTSGYKGVSRSGKKFRAEITMNKKNFYLGVFQNIIEAACAYDKKARELFGEFARLNFPDAEIK